MIRITISLAELSKDHLDSYDRIFAVDESNTEQIQVWDKKILPRNYYRNQPAILYAPLDLWVTEQDLKKLESLITRLCELDSFEHQRICENLLTEIPTTRS